MRVDGTEITRLIAASRAAMLNTGEETRPYDNSSSDLLSLDFDGLVHLRLAHQTKQAASGVRKLAILPSSGAVINTSANPATTLSDSEGESESDNPQSKTPSPKGLSVRRELTKKFNEIIRQQQDHGVGTGIERAARWSLAGNAANAAVVAGAESAKVLRSATSDQRFNLMDRPQPL